MFIFSSLRTYFLALANFFPFRFAETKQPMALQCALSLHSEGGPGDPLLDIPTIPDSSRGTFQGGQAYVGAPPIPRMSSCKEALEEELRYLLKRPEHLFLDHDEYTTLEKDEPQSTGAAPTSQKPEATFENNKLNIPLDPGAEGTQARVVVSTTPCVYDVYLLCANIPRNENLFRRHQVKAKYPSFSCFWNSVFTACN